MRALPPPTRFPPPGILQAVWCPFLYGSGPFGGPGTHVDAPAGGATMTPKRNQETKMSIGTKFALCAAIVVSTAATASAATKKQKTTAHRSGVHVQTSVRRPACQPIQSCSHRRWDPSLQSNARALLTKNWV